MFGKLSHADALKRPMLKWLLLFLTVILIGIVLASVFRYQQQNDGQPQDQEVAQVMKQAEPKPLSSVDEVTLQRQLQDILAKGKESDCATLGDARYQFACHDFFKIMNKK